MKIGGVKDRTPDKISALGPKKVRFRGEKIVRDSWGVLVKISVRTVLRNPDFYILPPWVL